MSLTNFAVRRPVAMATIVLALILLGANSYRKLGLESMPKMDLPYITVVTVYPGASPQEVETDVAKRIEDAVVSIDGLKHVTSSCMENACQTLLEFNLGVDVDVAANDVRDKLNLIQADLPEDAETPKVLKFDVNAVPIINLALLGDKSIDDLFDYADNTLKDRLSTIPGVAEVQLIGGSKREVEVLIDRAKLAARGLTALNIVQALEQGVTKIPSGRVRDAGAEYSVKFDAEFSSIEHIGSLQIANQDGQRCYLSDVAEVRMGAEEQRQAAFLDGRPCIAIRVVKKADANAVKLVGLVRAAYTPIKETLPEGMQLEWVTDDGEHIQASVDSAWSNIIQGILLTAAILFLFLYNWRSTLIVAITMPITIVIGFFFMQLLGYTLNLSTLLSIGLSIGILVTNSIVVIENIVHRLDIDPTPKEAARIGSGEVLVAVAASAITNVVVLFPIGSMSSRVGQFFEPFAYTMVAVTIVSLFISFTVTPILASLLLKKKQPGAKVTLLERVEARWNRMFERLEDGYGRLIHFLAMHRIAGIAVILCSLLLLVHSFSLLPKIGMSFVKDEDRGRIFVKLEYPTRYDLANTLAAVKEVEDRLKTVPTLQHVLTTVGKVEGIIGQSSEGVYLAQLMLTCAKKIERTESIHDLLADVRGKLAGYPDCIVSVNIPGTIGGQNKPVEVEIAGDDFAELDQLAQKISALAQSVPGVTDVDNTVRVGKPELRIRPDRAILADLGAPATGLGMMLRGNLEGIKASTFKEGARTYDIRVKLAEEEGRNQVEQFLFPGMPGNPVNLTAIANVENTLAPVQVTRSDKRRVSKVFGNLVGSTPLGTAVQNLDALVKSENLLPSGYAIRYAGMYEVMQEGNEQFLEAGIIAILLTYLTLAALLESFTQPFIILVTLPLALVGIIYALFITGESLSMFALLGSVMLIGVVVNNAILIMDRVNQHRAEGAPPRKAMELAAKDELRPIVMITLAAVLGMWPLATGTGLGSENRVGIGVASIGGLAISAVLTLLIVPVLYELFTRKNGEGTTPSPPTPPSDRHT